MDYIVPLSYRFGLRLSLSLILFFFYFLFEVKTVAFYKKLTDFVDPLIRRLLMGYWRVRSFAKWTLLDQLFWNI